jgi:hypothetical protein
VRLTFVKHSGDRVKPFYVRDAMEALERIREQLKQDEADDANE